MPTWSPGRDWEGEDAYVIGGGDSLRSFDWGSIRGKKTIGCNSAFILGADICSIVIFGDRAWWENIGKKQLPDYGGIVVGCPGSTLKPPLPNWLLTMERQAAQGLSSSANALAFNGNTGAMALNLALLLGAKRVFLLGFDMKLTDPKRPNWHDVRYEPGRAESYPLFIQNFAAVAKALPLKFPGREVWNVTDGSNLPYFPKVSIAEHFGATAKDGAA